MKLALCLPLVLVAVFSLVSAEVYFQEKFENGLSKWVISKYGSKAYGDVKLTAGDWHSSPDNKGLQLMHDSRHYALSAKFDKFLETTQNKTLVIQYSVKFQQGINCGGGYLKLLQDSAIKQQKLFTSNTPYSLMFGPDVCGATKRIHFIFNYKGKHVLWKKEPPCETDKLTHMYTAIIRPDNTYEVLVDGDIKEMGNILEDWDFSFIPKTVADPDAQKPADWEDEAEMIDTEDKKPENWDSIPMFIADPKAKKPADWDDEKDGAWKAPQIMNPDYKGEWKPRKIPNPNFKGTWKAAEVENPRLKEMYRQDNLNYAAFEIWTVQGGTIFDNILITDDEDVAKQEVDKFLESAQDERQMFEKHEEEQRKIAEENRKKAEKEYKKREEEEKRRSPEERMRQQRELEEIAKRHAAGEYDAKDEL